jgi:sporulation protein YlmC with PRC-barrel domain
MAKRGLMKQVLTASRGMNMTRVVPKFATAAAVAALLALGSGVASAQSAMPSGAAPPARTAAPPTSNVPSSTTSAPMKDPLASEDVSQISGSSVVASDGTSIGKVSTVLMDPSSKKVDRLVVAEGGVLGVGAHKVALPVDTFHWNSDKGSFTINKTADDLKGMPEWTQPQLAEAPGGSAASPMTPARDAGVAAGTNGSSPAGAASAPIAPSGKAR